MEIRKLSATFKHKKEKSGLQKHFQMRTGQGQPQKKNIQIYKQPNITGLNEECASRKKIETIIINQTECNNECKNNRDITTTHI